jgi:hypothetical protein
MKRYINITLYSIIFLFVSANSAEQAYTWVDDTGTTHFSETPPPESATAATLIEVLPASGAAPGGVTDNGFYSVINQAERMQTRRLEKEKLTAEKKLAEAQARKARAEAQAAQQDSYTNDGISYYPAYPYYPRYGHTRPWHGQRPGHGNRPEYGNRPGHGNRPGYPRPANPRTSLGKTPGMPHY